ncbi:MAG TPA: c-type cytochrome biogenesis protein CcmI [Nevskiaceae bacterium]|nr:c-type cytochrome biogenesis protein CcmI [Nevskiaceae bacterium]
MTPVLTLFLMLVLALIAGLLLARPWLQGRYDATLSRREANVAGYRQRLAELAAEEAAGLIDAEAARHLREELDRRLLADADGAPVAADRRPPPRPLLALWLGLLLSLLAAGGYWGLGGSWRVQARIEQAAADPAAAERLSVLAMVEGLQARLAGQPDDLEGWTLLARSLGVLERHAEAAEAYARALRLAPSPDADLLTGEGEMRALAVGRDLQGLPRERFEQALQVAPDHPRALWFAGLAALQAGETDRTRALWQRLADRPDLPPELRETLLGRLRELDAAGLAAAPAPAAPAAAAPPVQLRIRLALSEVPGSWPERAALFVYARAEPGPPMPVAVYRGRPQEVPGEIVLDDRSAMLPGVSLSQFSQWRVGARISLDGEATPGPGDFEDERLVSLTEAAAPVALQLAPRRP